MNENHETICRSLYQKVAALIERQTVTESSVCCRRINENALQNRINTARMLYRYK